MKVEVEYKPISKRDYEIFIHILARMLADFIEEQKRTKQDEK